MSIYEKMNEDATQTTGFYKPVMGKINQVRILADPIRGNTAFKSGEQKIQYQFPVTSIEDPKTPLVWGVSAKGALQQIISIVKANNLQTLAGAVLQVNVAGDGIERKYVILPIALPTPATTAQLAIDFPPGSLEKALPKLFAPEIPAAPKQ